MSNSCPDRKEIGWCLTSRSYSRINPTSSRVYLVPRDPDDVSADAVKIVNVQPKPFTLSQVYKMMSHWYDVPGENETGRLTHGWTEAERLSVEWKMERVTVTRYDVAEKMPKAATTEVYNVLSEHWRRLANEVGLPDCKMNLTEEMILLMLRKQFGG